MLIRGTGFNNLTSWRRLCLHLFHPVLVVCAYYITITRESCIDRFVNFEQSTLAVSSCLNPLVLAKLTVSSKQHQSSRSLGVKR